MRSSIWRSLIARATTPPGTIIGASANGHLRWLDSEEGRFIVYSTERADQQNSSVLNAAIVSVALAYVIAITSFLASTENLKNFGAVLLYLPFPALSLNSYISLQLAVGRIRRSYLLTLEALMQIEDTRSAYYPSFVALYHGLALGKTLRSYPFKILGAASYWSPLATSSLFTLYVLLRGASDAHISTLLILCAAGFYTLLVLLNIAVAICANRAVNNPRKLFEDAHAQLFGKTSFWSEHGPSPAND